MPGLVPGIHVFAAKNKTWMAGSSPAMTSSFLVASGNQHGLIPGSLVALAPRNDEGPDRVPRMLRSARQQPRVALLIRGPSFPHFRSLSLRGSRICVASFHAAPRPGHENCLDTISRVTTDLPSCQLVAGAFACDDGQITGSFPRVLCPSRGVRVVTDVGPRDAMDATRASDECVCAADGEVVWS